MKSVFIEIILTSILICGCSVANSPVETDISTSPMINNTVNTDIANAIVPHTSDPIQTDGPDSAFPIASGTHLMRYEDESIFSYMDYYLFIPENAKSNMPIIVFLHGDGQVGRQDTLENYGMMESARSIYGEDYPFIAVYPCTRIASWTDYPIPEMLIGLIESTIALCSADPQQVIITGHSRGAIGVWNMISTYGDYFAAAVPVSCGSDSDLNYSMCAKVPVLAIAGLSGDMEIRFQRQMHSIVEALIQVGGKAELMLLEDSDHSDTCTDAYTVEVFQWMLNN